MDRKPAIQTLFRFERIDICNSYIVLLFLSQDENGPTRRKRSSVYAVGLRATLLPRCDRLATSQFLLLARYVPNVAKEEL